MFVVQYPDGSRTYFHKGMCGVFENPLDLAKRCVERSGAQLMIESSSTVGPRWTPLV